MPRVNWKAVHDDDFRVPDLPLSDLAAELTGLLGDVDPRQRDDLALTVLGTWVERGVYDDLLPGLGDGMAAGLRVGLGREGDDSVFRRSFSVLVLTTCVDRDTARPLVPGGKVLEWGDRVATWLLAERDLRGFVATKGWAHALAHGADAVAALGRSPHLGGAELAVLLDVLGERVTAPGEHTFGDGEPDRLALATIEVLRRDRVPFDVVEHWVDRLVDGCPREVDPVQGPPAAAANLDGYLRALYLQLALGPRPPACRADLLLGLVHALRTITPWALGAPAERRGPVVPS